MTRKSFTSAEPATVARAWPAGRYWPLSTLTFSWSSSSASRGYSCHCERAAAGSAWWPAARKAAGNDGEPAQSRPKSTMPSAVTTRRCAAGAARTRISTPALQPEQQRAVSHISADPIHHGDGDRVRYQTAEEIGQSNARNVAIVAGRTGRSTRKVTAGANLRSFAARAAVLPPVTWKKLRRIVRPLRRSRVHRQLTTY